MDKEAYENKLIAETELTKYVSNDIVAKKPFVNWRPNAIHLNFPNGNWLSTTWDIASYADDHLSPGMFDRMGYFRGSSTCEIMIKCGDRLSKRLHKKFDGDGSVIGYLSFEDWLYVVNALAKEKKHDN